MGKLFILILFFLIVSGSISAQPYHSVFGKTSTSWNIVWFNLDFAGWSTFYVQYDTVLFNTYSYKKVLADDNGNTKLLLREDTVTGKVWCRSINTDCGGLNTTERLITDNWSLHQLCGSSIRFELNNGGDLTKA